MVIRIHKDSVTMDKRRKSVIPCAELERRYQLDVLRVSILRGEVVPTLEKFTSNQEEFVENQSYEDLQPLAPTTRAEWLAIGSVVMCAYVYEDPRTALP